MLMPFTNGKLVFEGEYAKIPSNTKDALVRYVERRIIPGGFLQAVLQNDLFAAVGYADQENLTHLRLIVQYVFNHIPTRFYGSRETLEEYTTN